MERGIVLYNQNRTRAARSYLEVAAQAGDSQAQFYLGEALRKNNRFMTREALQWLEASAQQGNSYAMIRLGRMGESLCSIMENCPEGSRPNEEWLKVAYELNETKSEQGDAEAMYLMFRLTSEVSWLERAAEAGHGLSQHLLADLIKNGLGTYWWPGSRQQDVERWYKASAESGYPPGMLSHALILMNKGDLTGYQHWAEEVAKTGYVSGVFEFGMLLVDPLHREFQQDLVKGYGVLSLLLELDGGGYLNKRFIEKRLPPIAAQMTPEQLDQALEYAEEWKSSHPPLSFFSQKLHPLDTLF